MNESTPPITKHEITADEFLKAAKGEAFEQTDWFFSETLREIKKRIGIDTSSLDDKRQYIVFVEADFTLPPGEYLMNLHALGKSIYKPAFIFFKCNLPGIHLYESNTDGWIFINTYINGDFQIERNSQSKYIWINDNSRCGPIKVVESRCGEVKVHENSQCGHVTVEQNSDASSILISNNSRCGSLSISEGSKCGSITINVNSEGGGVTVFNGSKCGDFMILNDSRVGDFFVYVKSQCGNLDINNNCKMGDIKIDLVALIGNINVSHNSRIGYIRMEEGSQSGNIIIGNNSQSEVISICINCQSGTITIYDSSASGINMRQNFCSIFLHNATIPLMRISKCSIHELVWQAETKGALYIDNCAINHLNLCKTSLLKDAVITIINSSIHIVQLQELLVQGQLVLRNIERAETPFAWRPLLEIDADAYDLVRSVGKLAGGIRADGIKLLLFQKDYYNHILENLNEEPGLRGHTKPLFRIVNSSLGKTEITGSDLTGFHFEYRDSRLLDIFISGSKLPKEKIDIYNEVPGEKLPDRVYFEQKVSFYNQLKKIYENQGDIVESTPYHAKSMANQERLLKIIYYEKSGNKLLKWWSDDGFNSLNFWLNKVSNNHGESWRRALGFSFLLLLSIYSLYFSSVNYRAPLSLIGVGDFLGNFFSFLDITHKIDFMVDKSELNAPAKFLDFFGRLATGYCIYQFISAFRRHGRRG